MSLLRKLAAGAAALGLTAALSACATAPPAPRSYTAFHAENPRSILVVPTLNNTVNVQAPEFFLSTISRPFGERGYYVFPAYMVKRLLESDGLSDAGLVHATDARRLAKLFGCDSVLFVAIQQWDSKYVVLATQTTVKFAYTLKSCKTGDVLWDDTQTMVYSPQASNSGNPLADLIAQAVLAAIEKGAPNYMPLTMQANAAAAATPGHGLPAGPYLSTYKQDSAAFP
jgi:hypothetical protein